MVEYRGDNSINNNNNLLIKVFPLQKVSNTLQATTNELEQLRSMA